MFPASLDQENKFDRVATSLRIIAWLWIVGVTVAYFAQVDLASVLALELTSVMAFELLGAAALAVGPGSVGLALSFVIERISYLTSDLNFF